MSDDFEMFDATPSGSIGGRPDTDISGMEPAAAREYVIAFITTLKQTRNERVEEEKQLQIWLDRIKLAESRNEPGLASRARDKALQIETKVNTLKAEETTLAVKVDFLKGELKRLSGKFQASIDVDQLLAEFEMVIGPPDTTAKAFKDYEAEAELEKLKRRLDEEKS